MQSVVTKQSEVTIPVVQHCLLHHKPRPTGRHDTVKHIITL